VITAGENRFRYALIRQKGVAMIDHDKYIVFKRTEFAEWLGQSGPTPPDLKDAVVIRLQDVFAYSALNAYGSAIMTTLEILDGQGTLPKENEKYLRELADYFAGMADEARRIRSKVPDA
jgi:hypothetical protein